MLRKLERDALRADLAAVETLLAERTEAEDPVGHYQYTLRRKLLEEQLAKLSDIPESSAAVGLFFGGKPVIGSRGINAEFGAQALEGFQKLIATHWASREGPLDKRGPVPQRDQSQLMITDVARGSVGFILEEFSDHQELLETPLRNAVDDVCDLIHQFSTADEERFGAATEAVDDRLLGGLKLFFKLLDDNEATLRVVEEEREFQLDRGSVHRARERTDALVLEENDIEVSGVLYVLPDARRFEFHPTDKSETLRGTISTDCLRHIIGDDGEVKAEYIGHTVSARLHVKTATLAGAAPRQSYSLTSISTG